MTNAHIIIPARFKSSRFPGKPLKKILGKEMIIRVAEICAKIISLKKIIIATDSVPIMKVCQKYGYQSLITPKNCKTGTDRVFHVAKKIKSDFYINVQGDEPLIDPLDIKKIIQKKIKYKNYVICGYCDVNYKNAISNNVPKIVINKNSDLTYISRSLIPGSKKKNIKKIKYFKQVCIYAFNYSQLKKFYEFRGKSIIENLEDIEILRFFDLKIPIKMVKVSNKSISVDIKEDMIKVVKVLKKNEKN
mgnify:CR=1 FL=1